MTERAAIDSLSELIQDDLICLLDSQFGEVEYVNEVKTLACNIVVDRINDFKKRYIVATSRSLGKSTNLKLEDK